MSAAKRSPVSDDGASSRKRRRDSTPLEDLAAKVWGQLVEKDPEIESREDPLIWYFVITDPLVTPPHGDPTYPYFACFCKVRGKSNVHDLLANLKWRYHVLMRKPDADVEVVCAPVAAPDYWPEGAPLQSMPPDEFWMYKLFGLYDKGDDFFAKAEKLYDDLKEHPENLEDVQCAVDDEIEKGVQRKVHVMPTDMVTRGHEYLESLTPRICFKYSNSNDAMLRPGGYKHVCEHDKAVRFILPPQKVLDTWRNKD